MKKFIKVAMTAALSLIMVLGMAMTALAAPSFTDQIAVANNGTGILNDSNKTQVGVTLNTQTAECATTEAQAAIANGKVDPNAANLDADEVLDYRFFMKDVDVTDPNYDHTTGVTVTFDVNFNPGTEIAVFHMIYNSNPEAWEFMGKYTVDDNKQITVYFANGLTPVSMYTITTIGNTGDSSHVILWGSLMLVAAAGVIGVVAFGKKRK
jgi:hypothetical protein